MIRVGFIGVPGAGKTSTARGLAATCRKIERLKNVELISEYARRYISKYGPIENITDQYRILQKQLEWEENIPKEVNVLITDSPVHLGFLYALELRKLDDVKEAMYLNDIFKRLNKLNCPRRYDIIFHLPPVLEPIRDGVRSEQQFDSNWRKEADNKLQLIFDIFPPKKFITINSTDLDDRVNECLGHF